MTREKEELIIHYRNLVSALLTHTWIDDEGTEAAIADFRRYALDGCDTLTALIGSQGIDWRNRQ